MALCQVQKKNIPGNRHLDDKNGSKDDFKKKSDLSRLHFRIEADDQ